MLTYSVSGDLKFISHHDMVRLFQRALARAGLPVNFTEGFNPHPRMSVPLPRPVGIASQCEAIVIEFGQSLGRDSLLARLAEQMPAGIGLCDARPLAIGERPRAVRVGYRLAVEPAERPAVRARIDEVLAAGSLAIERRTDAAGSTRHFDVRPYLLDMEVREDGVVFSLKVTGQGTARPGEVAALFGHDPGTINHRIERLFVEWA